MRSGAHLHLHQQLVSCTDVANRKKNKQNKFEVFRKTLHDFTPEMCQNKYGNRVTHKFLPA